MYELICRKCGRKTEYSSEKPQFCSACGCRFDFDEVDAMLEAASRETDTAKKHDILVEAQKRYPDSIEVRKQLLFLGRLWERGGKPDFYRIPYWGLNAYEMPKLFSAKDRVKMLDSFFKNPEYLALMDVVDDKDAFTDEYLRYMAKEYIDLFIKSSSANTTFLGFRRKPEDVMRRSAAALRSMLENIDKSEYPLENEIKTRLKNALLDGFEAVFQVKL